MAAFDWFIPAASDQVVGANVADDYLAAINTLVTGNSGNAAASWEVANYASASPKSVLLKRKNGSAGRIIFFGQQGSTPNAAAVKGTPTASVLYVGYSASSTSNTPDASFLSAAPLSASDYMVGLRCFPQASATWRVNYADGPGGLVVLISNVSNGMGLAGGGEICTDTTGTNLSAVFASGTSGNLGQWPTIATANGGSVFGATVGADASYTAGDAAMMVRKNSSNQQVFRALLLGTGVAAKLRDSANTTAYFYPIPLVYHSSDGTLVIAGKLRQIGFGPLCDRETTHDDGSTRAYGHQSTTSGTTLPGVWFVDAEL